MRRGFIAAAALCSACGMMELPADIESGGEIGGEGPSAQAARPVVEVLLTDAPAAVDEVWVDIARVEIESEAGWQTLVEEPQRHDLLTLQNDVTAALGSATLAAGHYGQLRMIVSSAEVVVAGVTESLTISSGSQTGIKIPLDATIEDGMVYTLVLDFDAARSIHQTGQGMRMTPVIHVKELTGVPVPPEPEPEPEPEAEPDAGPVVVE